MFSRLRAWHTASAADTRPVAPPNAQAGARLCNWLTRRADWRELVSAAMAELMNLARLGNGYFDATAPFRARKTDLAACGRAINVCLQTIRALTTIMAPFLPFSAEKCLAMLNLENDALAWDRATDQLPAGKTLGEAQLLFKKLDPSELFQD